MNRINDTIPRVRSFGRNTFRLTMYCNKITGLKLSVKSIVFRVLHANDFSTARRHFTVLQFHFSGIANRKRRWYRQWITVARRGQYFRCQFASRPKFLRAVYSVFRSGVISVESNVALNKYYPCAR